MHRFVVALATLLLAAVALPAACGDGDSSGESCDPGSVINCPCPGGVLGTATCLNDGTGYNACICPEPTGPSSVAASVSSAVTGSGGGGMGGGGMGGGGMGGAGGAGGGSGGMGGAGGTGGAGGGMGGAGGAGGAAGGA